MSKFFWAEEFLSLAGRVLPHVEASSCHLGWGMEQGHWWSPRANKGIHVRKGQLPRHANAIKNWSQISTVPITEKVSAQYFTPSFSCLFPEGEEKRQFINSSPNWRKRGGFNSKPILQFCLLHGSGHFIDKSETELRDLKWSENILYCLKLIRNSRVCPTKPSS